jgi:hypothetical protein
MWSKTRDSTGTFFVDVIAADEFFGGKSSFKFPAKPPKQSIESNTKNSSKSVFYRHGSMVCIKLFERTSIAKVTQSD